MKCVCGALATNVIESYTTVDEEVYRVRECPDCRHRFTTVEAIVETQAPIQLVRGGAR